MYTRGEHKRTRQATHKHPIIPGLAAFVFLLTLFGSVSTFVLGETGSVVLGLECTHAASINAHAKHPNIPGLAVFVFLLAVFGLVSIFVLGETGPVEDFAFLLADFILVSISMTGAVVSGLECTHAANINAHAKLRTSTPVYRASAPPLYSSWWDVWF